MDKLVIDGGYKLQGELKISGSKNSALPILFASLLTADSVEIHNVPDLADINTTTKLLTDLGCSTEYDSKEKVATISAKQINKLEASYDLVRTMRASVLVLGPLLARFQKAKVSLPGGCSIGARPVNLHLSALEKMGAKILVENGYIQAECKKLKGAEITFDQVSVGATENLMMAASIAEGKTVLRNVAQEPEIVDLADFLKKMGAKISGEGSSEIVIEGVSKLHATKHQVISDRIEAGTYLTAAAITNGSILIKGISEQMFGAVIQKLKECGLEIKSSKNEIHLKSIGKLKSTPLTTAPFPGFPTDMQAQFMALMTVAEGTSIIRETIFENRFMHVAELQRLGAQITTEGNTAVVKGFGGTNLSLTGATVMATDLRASACLVLAALAAKGTTQVRRIYHLDRGYEKMELKLKTLGAKINREKE